MIELHPVDYPPGGLAEPGWISLSNARESNVWSAYQLIFGDLSVRLFLENGISNLDWTWRNSESTLLIRVELGALYVFDEFRGLVNLPGEIPVYDRKKLDENYALIWSFSNLILIDLKDFIVRQLVLDEDVADLLDASTADGRLDYVVQLGNGDKQVVACSIDDIPVVEWRSLDR